MPFILIFVFLLSVLLPACGSGGKEKAANTTTSSGSVTLTWDPPEITVHLAGYNIYYGPSSRNYKTVIDVGNVTSYKINDLPPGTYFFAVTAYDTSRNESAYSNEVSKTLSQVPKEVP